jgi:hypothetical protein
MTTHMMRKVGVHDNHEVSCAEIEAMYVCGSAPYALSLLEQTEVVDSPES